MEATELKQIRSQHPLRKVLAELGLRPTDLSTASGVNIASISKSLNGSSPMPSKLRNYLSEQGVDLFILDSDIEAWRESFRHDFTKNAKRVSIKGMFASGGPIPKEAIDEVIAEWNKE
jgi:hypothetical protein